MFIVDVVVVVVDVVVVVLGAVFVENFILFFSASACKNMFSGTNPAFCFFSSGTQST